MIPKLVSPDLFLVPVAVLWMMEAGCLGRGCRVVLIASCP